MINSCHIFQLISFEHQQLLWLTDRRMHGNVQLTQNQNKIQTDHYNSRQVVSRTNKNTHHMHCTQRRLQIYFQTKLPTSVIQSSVIHFDAHFPGRRWFVGFPWFSSSTWSRRSFRSSTCLYWLGVLSSCYSTSSGHGYTQVYATKTESVCVCVEALKGTPSAHWLQQRKPLTGLILSWSTELLMKGVAQFMDLLYRENIPCPSWMQKVRFSYYTCQHFEFVLFSSFSLVAQLPWYT